MQLRDLVHCGLTIRNCLQNEIEFSVRIRSRSLHSVNINSLKMYVLYRSLSNHMEFNNTLLCALIIYRNKSEFLNPPAKRT